MKNYMNQEIKFDGCPGCEYAKHKFEIPCGMIYESDLITVSQDWELPIPGFIVASPKRHITSKRELTIYERTEIDLIFDITEQVLQESGLCDEFIEYFDEKRHFHKCIVPKSPWMKELFGNVSENLGKIYEYAKTNLRNEEIYNKIQEITDLIKNEITKRKSINLKKI